MSMYIMVHRGIKLWVEDFVPKTGSTALDTAEEGVF